MSYDQAYTKVTLAKVLRRGDFPRLPQAVLEDRSAILVAEALEAERADFGGENPLSSFVLRRKSTFCFLNKCDHVIGRKLSLNIERLVERREQHREQIIGSLRALLSEGIPYRVYRLDIASFYESFRTADVRILVASSLRLSASSKAKFSNLCNHFEGLGGTGLPRGLALSAAVAELMMRDFDHYVRGLPQVYFFARYVDDIVLITSGTEDQEGFLKSVELHLPSGLKLNSAKQRVQTLGKLKKSADEPGVRCRFDYLGYSFRVSNPSRKKDYFRIVRLEIADGKVDRFKRRICRALEAYQSTGDSSLLLERVRYLTSNFAITDKDTRRKRLAGIFHSYRQLSSDSESLRALDDYLRAALGKGWGRSLTPVTLSPFERRAILGQSFAKGHSAQIFWHFSPSKIDAIQKCWKND